MSHFEWDREDELIQTDLADFHRKGNALSWEEECLLAAHEPCWMGRSLERLFTLGKEE